MSDSNANGNGYKRYHIETESAPDIQPWPSRFKVKVNRPKLAKLLISELIEFRSDLDAVLSRPCVYGVFSGPVGGFAPRERLCVGCLRCTTQYPDIVEIRHNPARASLGDSYFRSDFVNALAYEASTGRIPVKGAGYRGLFGGQGWDGMWTDMSEIVRPTRDGIHGREFISTAVDVGAKPAYLEFGPDGTPRGNAPQIYFLPLPMIFDAPPATAASAALCQIYAEAARQIDTLAVLPLSAILEHGLGGRQVVPLVGPLDRNALAMLTSAPAMVAMDGWDAALFEELQTRFPESLLCLRTPFEAPDTLLDHYRAGVRIFHLTASYHGRDAQGEFVHDLIRQAHLAFVENGVRDEITLLGSGGIIAAEHVPKAIIAGLDAVALDTVPLVALQACFEEECRDRETSRFHLPEPLPVPWGVQRLKNMSAAWRDQLLEILGAMGLREVRRLRGETGRAMYQIDLEREAFAGIEGYDD